MSIDLDFLTRNYFYFDKPVEYKLSEYSIQIHPISVEFSEIFLSSIGLFSIDKNSLPDASIISMSYLQFITDVLLTNDFARQQFINLLSLCLDMKQPKIAKDNFNKSLLFEGNNKFFINGIQFEDIRRIILYQNILHFDDNYINPDLKKAMIETDELKNKGIDFPNLERKIAIITAHTGISKEEQLKMTYRSHSLLFEEVCGEIEFTTIRPIALFSGQGSKIDHWIYKKKRNKFDGYITSIDDYTKSMGSDKNAIHTSMSNHNGENLMNQFKNFD